MPNQQGPQQPLAPQYPHMHPQQPMAYQHAPYMQPHQQQQQQQYSYQPQMQQNPFNQGQQQQPILQAANQSQQPTMPPGAYNQGQRPPMPQAAYGHGLRPPMPQPAYNQGHQPQMPPHASYNQGQQLQGIRIPQSQPQHAQQSPGFNQHAQQSPGFNQPVQPSQVLQPPQAQGLQMSPPQGQLQHGFPFTPQQGKQAQHGHGGALSHGQQSIDAGGHEGKQTGFSLPPSQQRGQAPLPNQQLPSNHQRPEAHNNQLNIHGVGGPPYPAKHHLGGLSPRETNNTSFLNSPAQIPQGIVDNNYRQQLASNNVVPNHIAPSPGRPPVGFKRGNSEDQFEKHEPHSSGRFDGISAPHQQPKLAALPPSQNHLVITDFVRCQ
jgi:ATP-dependent RNA helicase DDX5/DBP2